MKLKYKNNIFIDRVDKVLIVIKHNFKTTKLFLNYILFRIINVEVY